MKQKMKHLVSLIALLVMMVSMFSVCVFPAAAATAEEVTKEYNSLLQIAYVVNPAWEGLAEGSHITYSFRGQELNGTLLAEQRYFASFADAWAAAKKNGETDPVFLLCAGDHCDEMVLDSEMSSVTILGPNAGYDPNVKSAAENEPWTLSESRANEAVVRHNIYVKKDVGNCNITIDGLTFGSAITTVETTKGIGGAFVDHERSTGSSELTVKNTVFRNAGNSEDAYGSALYLRSSGHARTVKLSNLYVTGQNSAATASNLPISFVSAYFTELFADNIAYINNKNGFLGKTFFALGVSPTVEVSNSCFFNEAANTAEGYIISMDNLSFNFNFSSNADRLITTTSDTDVAAYTGDKRPAASLELTNNVFYNASAKTGVIHYEFINARSVVLIRDNYFYAEDDQANNGKTVMDTEFVSQSSSVDQTSAIKIEGNRLIGTYKIPTLKGSNVATSINMSDNYFGTTLGQCVPQPIYMDADNTRLIRSSFYVDEAMTTKQSAWFLSIDNWSLAWVNAVEYTASLIAYAEKSIADSSIAFSSSDGFTVQLYKSAVVSTDGIVTALDEADKIEGNKLTDKILGTDPYASTVIYAQVTNPNNKDFAPVYTITVKNMGSTAGLTDFSTAMEAVYGKNVYLYNPDIAGLPTGTVVPSVWKNEKYLCKAGVNTFATVREIIDCAESLGNVNPTILIPAGDYTEELLITGTCTIYGEQHGVNPNEKPYTYNELTQENIASAAWTLNPERDQNRETTFHAVIRVSEDADDYEITLDGIKMVDGCSYVDDYARTGHNVTIFKNIYADNAGGGLDRTGATNGQVFRFWKAYDANSTDLNHMYMYDCRLDNFVGRTVFGPYFEKFVVDGVFFGNATGGTRFMNSFSSRDIANPYYEITNSYLYNNAGTGQDSFYMFGTRDHDGVLSKKTNIIYNFDGNVFYNATTSDFGGMEIFFTGNNMQFNLVNNTMIHTTNSGVFLASTIGTSRFVGSCPNENVSDMLIVKNNRLIGQNCLPTTNGTGNGTMFDFSGNYFAASVTSAAKTPEEAWRVEVSQTGNLGTYTWEQCIRNKIDYTYMDWAMTIKSSSSAAGDTDEGEDYTKTAGMYQTGNYYNETVNGVNTVVYRDTVPADCTVYTNPIKGGKVSTVQLLDANKNAIDTMNLVGASTTFYCRVTTGSKVEDIMLVIERTIGNDCRLLAIDDFYIDDTNSQVIGYLDLMSFEKYDFSTASVSLSGGATMQVFNAAGDQVTRVDQTEQAYMVVTSEDGSSSRTYTFTFYNKNTTDPAVVGVAAITSIEGMTKAAAENTYTATISSAETSFSFKPVALYGSTVKVYLGTTEVAPNSEGVYTVDVSGNQAITAVASCGSVNTSYTLKLEKGVSSETKLETLKFKTEKWTEATVSANGKYEMNLMYADSADVEAQVSVGATYQLYKDYACTKPYANNRLTVLENGVYQDGFDVYLKVTAEDGKHFDIYTINVRSQANNRTIANIFGVKTENGKTEYIQAESIGKYTYVLNLPAGTSKIDLTGGVFVTEEYLKMTDEQKNAYVYNLKLSGGTLTFFADPNRTIELPENTINLEQKVTRIYTSTLVGSYVALNPVGEEESVNISATNAVIYIISDRAAVSYKDAATYQDNWVKPYVEYLNSNNYGIFKGDDNGNININDNISRYEVAAIATRVLGLDVSKYTSGTAPTNYADAIDEWAQPYVRAAAAVGIMNGHNEVTKLVFDGDSYATREQVIKVLVSVCVLNEGGTPAYDSSGAVTADAATNYYLNRKTTIDLDFSTHKFEDTAKISDWAVPYMKLAVSEFGMIGGSLEGTKLYLFPERNITRAQVAKMVAVYYQNS